MDINPNVENYALHLKNTCTDEELHNLVGSLYTDREVMQAWHLTVEEYFTAIEIVYFAPREIKSQLH